MLYHDAVDRHDTPAGRISAAIEDHAGPIGRRHGLDALETLKAGAPLAPLTEAVLLDLLYSIKTPDGRQACRDAWNFIRANGAVETRKAA